MIVRTRARWVALIGLLLQALRPIDGFANYLLTDSGCRVYLETGEVIMNSPVQEAVVDAPLRIQLTLPDGAGDATTTVLHYQNDHMNEPTQHETIVLDPSVAFPLRLQARIAPPDDQPKLPPDVADYQFILQVGEDSDASFESGACEQSKRAGGRGPTETYTLMINKPNVELWGAWAAGHEPVKLLQGYRFVTQQPQANDSDQKERTTKEEGNDEDEPQGGEEEDSGRLAEDKMSWEYYVLQEDCNPHDASGLTIPNHVREVQEASSASVSLPTELVVVNEEEPPEPDNAPTILQLGWSNTSQPHVDQLGHVLLSVTTVDQTIQDPSKTTTTTIHPAKFSSSHATCNGTRLLLPHTNEFPLALQIPPQPHSDHVVVTVHVVFDVQSEHDNPKAPLYQIQPLALHWTSKDKNKDRSKKAADMQKMADEKQMSWEYSALQDEAACDATTLAEGITIPHHIQAIQTATAPAELVVVEEKELESPDSPAVLKLDWPNDTVTVAAKGKLGHVLLHVTTSDAVPSEKIIHPARFTNTHAVCSGRRLLLPHLNDFPLALEIPHQPHSNHVVVTVHAVYDLVEEHDQENATLYKIKPLELHWTPRDATNMKAPLDKVALDLQKRELEMAEAVQRHMDQHRRREREPDAQRQREEARRQKQRDKAKPNDRATFEEDKRKRDAAERQQREKRADELEQRQQHRANEREQQQQQRRAEEDAKRERRNNKKDPQRALDESIQLDLRQHLKELQEKQDATRRRTGEVDVTGGRRRPDHLESHMEELKRNAYRQKHKEQAGSVDDPVDFTRQRDKRQHEYPNRKKQNQGGTNDDDDTVPLVLWQDSSYYLGLIILVGGIYGTIVVCTFLSRVMGEKDRQE